MLNDEQRKFIINQAKTEDGQAWQEIFKTLVEGLYSSRGISIDDIKPRQIAAEIIEKEIIKISEIGEQELTPQKNNEYV